MSTLLEDVTEVVSRNADDVVHIICDHCYWFVGTVAPEGVVALCGEPIDEGDEQQEEGPACPMCADVTHCPKCGGRLASW